MIIKGLKYKSTRTVLFIITLFLYLGNLNSQNQNQSFSFFTNDSVLVKGKWTKGQGVQLPVYSAFVSTPICEEAQCHAVELLFYWDALGNFMRYDTIPGNPLTKLEHVPFTTNDYQALQKLLQKKDPAFAGMKKEDLISDEKIQTIDGFSGATIEAIKGEVIPGAVYSCYVLWHVANGIVRDSILHSTANNLNSTVVESLAAKKEGEANYFLIENFKEDDFINYQHLVLDMIEQGEGYLPKHTIERLPGGLLLKKDFQDKLGRMFKSIDYYAQKSLLNRLKSNLISNNLAKVLISDLTSDSQAKNKHIIEVICSKPIRIDKEAIQFFENEVKDRRIELSKQQKKEMRRCLNSF